MYNEKNVINCIFHARADSSKKYIVLGEQSIRETDEKTPFRGWTLASIAENFNNGSWIVISSPNKIYEVW